MADMNSDTMMADFMKSIEGNPTADNAKAVAPAPVMNPQNAITSPQDEEKLLGEIKNSISDMQNRMQDAYKSLQTRHATGHSKDKRVKAEFTATYDFVGLDFATDALEGGVDEFKQRVNEALKEATANEIGRASCRERV